jgi:hypothetical protein
VLLPASFSRSSAARRTTGFLEIAKPWRAFNVRVLRFLFLSVIFNKVAQINQRPTANIAAQYGDEPKF